MPAACYFSPGASSPAFVANVGITGILGAAEEKQNSWVGPRSPRPGLPGEAMQEMSHPDKIPADPVTTEQN